MGLGVGVSLGCGLGLLVTGLSGLDCFSLVKTMASVIIITRTITATTTPAMMSLRLSGLKGGRRQRS